MEFKSYKCPEKLSKIHLEMRKILKFQKASRRKKRIIKIILNNEIIERSSVGTEDLNTNNREKETIE